MQTCIQKSIKLESGKITELEDKERYFMMSPLKQESFCKQITKFYKKRRNMPKVFLKTCLKAALISAPIFY